MFVRLTTKTGVKINVNLNQIVSVTEQEEGSVLILAGGGAEEIQESGQTFRNAVKKKSIFPGSKVDDKAPEAIAA